MSETVVARPVLDGARVGGNGVNRPRGFLQAL